MNVRTTFKINNNTKILHYKVGDYLLYKTAELTISLYVNFVEELCSLVLSTNH